MNISGDPHVDPGAEYVPTTRPRAERQIDAILSGIALIVRHGSHDTGLKPIIDEWLKAHADVLSST